MVNQHTQLKDITNENIQLIARTPTGVAVTKRIERSLSEWVTVDKSETILPEKRYRATNSLSIITLGNTQGLYEIFNASENPIFVECNVFDNGQTRYVLQAGWLFQSRCTLNDDGTARTYTRLALDVTGLESKEVQQTPDNAGTYQTPPDLNNVQPGSHVLQDGDRAVISHDADTVANLPKEWYYWLTNQPGGTATVEFNFAGTPNTHIYFRDSDYWATVNDAPEILIANGEVIKITLKEKDETELAASAELATAIAGVGNNYIYIVETIIEAIDSTAGLSSIHNMDATREPTITDDIDEGYVLKDILTKMTYGLWQCI